jgi:hypothetical protein
MKIIRCRKYHTTLNINPSRIHISSMQFEQLYIFFVIIWRIHSNSKRISRMSKVTTIVIRLLEIITSQSSNIFTRTSSSHFDTNLCAEIVLPNFSIQFLNSMCEFTIGSLENILKMAFFKKRFLHMGIYPCHTSSVCTIQS